MHGFYHNTDSFLCPTRLPSGSQLEPLNVPPISKKRNPGPSDEFMRGGDLRPMSDGKPLRSDHFPERRQTHQSKVSDDSRQALCARPTECAPEEVLWKHLRKCQGHETSRPYVGLIFAQTTYYKRPFGRKQIDASCASGPGFRRVLSGRQRAWQSTIIQNGRVSGAKPTGMLQRLVRLRRSKI
ncbi:hypothetical protein F5Y13DRAFT_177858 [Hypoxylon sp. FL1857]|nr:hypothetical protein F5Y13DRAFT_177858 [Hypoxylon sp. FL1857]